MKVINRLNFKRFCGPVLLNDFDILQFSSANQVPMWYTGRSNDSKSLKENYIVGNMKVINRLNFKRFCGPVLLKKCSL